MTVMEASDIQIEAIRTLSADLKAAARTLSRVEARYLVDAYYILQRDRIRARHQERTLAAGDEPHSLITWLGDNAAILERNLKTVLGVYAATHVVGRWAQAQVGIGPVISAGLIAHIDITRAPTVGHIWRFAGLDPTVARARKGERRPWNGALKRLCWLIGESFKKTSNHEDGFYGALYRQRKAQEIERNEAGLFREQAERALAEKNFERDTNAKAAYLEGKLPPGRLDLRAMRYATKIFLAHFHHVAYYAQNGTHPPKPYALAILGHAHEVQVPEWPFSEEGTESSPRVEHVTPARTTSTQAHRTVRVSRAERRTTRRTSEPTGS